MLANGNAHFIESTPLEEREPSLGSARNALVTRIQRLPDGSAPPVAVEFDEVAFPFASIAKANFSEPPGPAKVSTPLLVRADRVVPVNACASGLFRRRGRWNPVRRCEIPAPSAVNLSDSRIN